MFNDKDINELYSLLGDIEWRMDNLYYIQDEHGRCVKFIRNDSQMEFWMSMWLLNIILKDRQRGFSTLIAMFILDQCMFFTDTSAGIIDITLPDAKKKLAKISYAYERLPDYLKAANPLITDAKESIEFSNGSSIHVSTSHRGGTLQILHVSEMGKIAARKPECSRELRTGALNTVATGNYVFVESTAEGNSGDFFDFCQEARSIQDNGERLTEMDYKFIFFAWWMGEKHEIDPEGVNISLAKHKYFDDLEKELKIEISARKRAWYVKKEISQKDDMTREFPSTPDEAFKAAIDGSYLSKQISFLRSRNMIGPFSCDPQYSVNSAWDFGLNDRMCIWLHQYIGLQHRLVGYISGTDEDVLFYWREMQKLPYVWGRHFLPHDAGHRRIGSTTKPSEKPKTLEQILNLAGMRNTKVVTRCDAKSTAIQESKQFIVQCYFNVTECEEGITSLQRFRRKWNDKKDDWESTPFKDRHMHGYDAFETLARGIAMYGVEVDKGFVPIVAAVRPLDSIIGM